MQRIICVLLKKLKPSLSCLEFFWKIKFLKCIKILGTDAYIEKYAMAVESTPKNSYPIAFPNIQLIFPRFFCTAVKNHQPSPFHPAPFHIIQSLRQSVSNAIAVPQNFNLYGIFLTLPFNANIRTLFAKCHLS